MLQEDYQELGVPIPDKLPSELDFQQGACMHKFLASVASELVQQDTEEP